MHANMEWGGGTRPALWHSLFLCSGPHKVSRTNVLCMGMWFLMPMAGTVNYSSHVQQTFMSSIKLFHKFYKKELYLMFSALVAAKIIKTPLSMTISSWNRGYWKLLQLLWFLFTASLKEDFASVTIPLLDNEINKSWAPESSLLGTFVMNYNKYYYIL